MGWKGESRRHSLSRKGIKTGVARGQMKKLGTHATSHRMKDGVLEVYYQGTKVVEMDINNDILILDTGGWKTATTKARMNQASNQFNLAYRVYQKNNKWYVELQNGKVFPFDNNKIKIDMAFNSILYSGD